MSKYFSTAMLAIHWEEISLIELFWFIHPYNMGPNHDKHLLKEQAKRAKHEAKYQKEEIDILSGGED